MARWRRTACQECNGTGLVVHYVGVDFEGADDCSRCWGSGSAYVSEGGAIARYPGHEFVGFDRALFATCDPTTEEGSE